MATWTELHGLTFTPRFITYDEVNSKCAYGSQDGSYALDAVYEYVEDGDTETKVLDRTVLTDFLNIEGIAYFNETLFAVVFYDEGGTDRSECVFSYDGTPNNWTLETKLFDTVGQYDIDHGRIWASPAGIMAYAVDGTSGETYGDMIKYSTNGTSWSSGSVGGFKAYKYCVASGNTIQNYPHCNIDDVYARFCTAQTPYTASIVKFSFSTGSLTEVKASDTYGFRCTFNQGSYAWTTAGHYSPLSWASTNDDSSWNKLPECSWLLDECWALGDDTKIYKRSGLPGSWVEEDDPSVGHTFYNDEQACFFLDNDGQVRLVCRDADVSHWAIWKYSEVISPPAAKFYYGVNTLTYRSDLDISAMNPLGLLVDDTQGKAWVASAAANAVMVERATSADNFVAWTDLTGSLDDTLTVEALARIK